jgi:hypothetical protein
MWNSRTRDEHGYLEIQDHGLSATQLRVTSHKILMLPLKQSWEHENGSPSDYLLNITFAFLTIYIQKISIDGSGKLLPSSS